MSSYNKAKGSKFETDIENYTNENGLKCRRLPRAGAKDIGDAAIELRNGHVIVIEAKNTAAVNMAQYLREAEVEAEHYDQKYNKTTYGVVVHKTRGKSIGKARVTMELDTLINLLNWSELS